MVDVKGWWWRETGSYCLRGTEFQFCKVERDGDGDGFTL